MIPFKKFVTEGKMLDVSILNINKALNNESKIKSFLDSSVIVEEKTDGTKLTIIRNEQPISTDFMDNWLFAFKGNLFYPEEFEGTNNAEVKANSIGVSQYGFVLDHFKKIHPQTKSIPTNTEFFVEYLMSKDTLTREYQHKHGMVLIGYAKTRYKVNNGKLESSPGEMITYDRDKYVNTLKLDVPLLLFDGKMNSVENFSKGIKSHNLKASFDKHKHKLNYDDPNSVFSVVKEIFTDFESKYVGTPEGVVIKQGGNLYKIVQADQYDKETRAALKNRYRMDRDKEDAYFKEIHKEADEIVDGLNLVNLRPALKELSQKVYGQKPPISHDKKDLIKIQDDLFLTAKNKILRRLKGNNWAFFGGKFLPTTKAHFSIIKDALKKFDGVVVGIVRGKSNRDLGNVFTLEMMKKSFIEEFGNRLRVIEIGTGNLINYFRKTDKNINAILCGTDRKEAYEKQLIRNMDVKVIETKRNDDDTSATKVRDAIKKGDYASYKRMIAEPLEDRKYFDNFGKKL